MNILKTIKEYLSSKVQGIAEPDKKSQVVELTEERDKRCRPIVRELFMFLATEPNLLENIGSAGITEKKLSEYYGDLALRFMTSIDKTNLKLTDFDYIFRTALQPIDLLKQKVQLGTDHQYNKATEYLWGVEDIDLFLEWNRVDDVYKLSKGEVIENSDSETVDK